MPRVTYKYEKAHTGEIVRIEVRPSQLTPRKDFDAEEHGTMSQKILKGYYAMEQKHGARFPSNYPKGVIKRVHEDAIASGFG